MREPTTTVERRAMEKAYASTDPFAIARWEQPDCKYLRVVDQRTRNNLRCTFVAAVPATHPYFDMLPDDQTITITDDQRHAPTVIDLATAAA